MNTPSIEVEGLQKSFKNVQVLKGVSFTVERGTIFALLGANGAGKTTTINILTTLLPADKGIANVDGLNVSTRAKEVRKRIGLTGQFAAVDDVLTGRENLVLIGELRHVSNPVALATSLLKQFDLSDAGDRRASTYSGGMHRRLDIAMSLIGSPSIIFLDEPTTGLDPQSRNMMWEKIKSLANDGTTVFLTTQYLEEADQLADMIAVLNQGKIVAQGTASELKKLLPQGEIELTFQDEDQLKTADRLFGKRVVRKDVESCMLAVATDGSVAQITELLTKLQQAHIKLLEFSRKTPTLDEAFLKIINDHTEDT